MYGNYFSRTTSAKSSNGVSSSTGAFREWVDFDGLVSDLLEAGWREKRRQELYFSVGERQKRELYQKHGRRVCSGGEKTEQEGGVVKGKEVEEAESEEEEEENVLCTRRLLQCWTELEKWIRREFVVDDAGERDVDR